MTMDVYQFLAKLNKFYPSNDKDDMFNERVNEYSKEILGIANSKDVEYDYDKIFSHLLKNYRYKTFPTLADIINVLDEGIVRKTQQECIDAGKVLIVTLPNGFRYEFVISSIGRPKDEVLAKLYKRFGECKVVIYPAGTCIIGNQIVVPETEENQGQSIKQGSLYGKEHIAA